MQPLAGYQLEREGSHAVALELGLDDELRREGLAREVVHAIQNARKGAGLQVEDRIELALGGDEELLGAARDHEAYMAQETLAVRLSFNGAADGTEADHRGPPAAHRTRASLQRGEAPYSGRGCDSAKSSNRGAPSRATRPTRASPPGSTLCSSTIVPYGVALTEKISVTGSPGLPVPQPSRSSEALPRSARSFGVSRKSLSTDALPSSIRESCTRPSAPSSSA